MNIVNIEIKEIDSWFVFETSLKAGLAIWARLANRAFREDYRIRHELRWKDRPGDVGAWAQLVLGLAQYDEGGNAPQAEINGTLSEGYVLRWRGSWTEGRQVEVQVHRDSATVRFKTGTGKPSQFLNKVFESSLAEVTGEVIPQDLARKVRENLAAAYGGFSQLSPSICRAAVGGHVFNGDLSGSSKEVALETMRHLLLLEEDQWGTDFITPDDYVRCEREIGDCWERAHKRPATYKVAPVVD